MEWIMFDIILFGAYEWLELCIKYFILILT